MGRADRELGAYGANLAGAAPFTLEELRGFLADKLGRHELPAALEFRDALPKTPVGKLWRKGLVRNCNDTKEDFR